MSLPDRNTYLKAVVQELLLQWPKSRPVHVVCHGHSVPAGYFATPLVDTFRAYPHLFHLALKKRYPCAVCNVIVTAVGGENAEQGAARFERDVLCHRPDLVTIDYGLNDRNLGVERAMAAWRAMVAAAEKAGAKVILLTPTHDDPALYAAGTVDPTLLPLHAQAIRTLAEESVVGLADSYDAFDRAIASGTALRNLLSWVNHPDENGHALVAGELMRWFPPYIG